MDSIIVKAMDFATHAHKGQVDKIGEPYINHPKNVSMILLTSPAFHNLSTEDKTTALASAWLHDVVEDTDYAVEDLQEAGFSNEIIKTVQLLTYDKSHLREDYYKKILTSEIARAVKVADVVHNSMLERLTKLPEESQKRMLIKYTKTIQAIVRPDELDWFHSKTKHTLNK